MQMKTKMDFECKCGLGVPVISDTHPTEPHDTIVANHVCSNCDAHLFEIKLSPGTQVIATENILSNDGQYVIPKGRLIRITAFCGSTFPDIGILFSGLLAAGPFHPKGFSAKWDIMRLTAS